jgi:hypothetical protein
MTPPVLLTERLRFTRRAVRARARFVPYRRWFTETLRSAGPAGSETRAERWFVPWHRWVPET